MLADKIYDTINVRKKIVELKINPIIASNIKNTKDPEKLKMKHLTDHPSGQFLTKRKFIKKELQLKIHLVGYLKIEDYLGDMIKM